MEPGDVRVQRGSTCCTHLGVEGGHAVCGTEGCCAVLRARVEAVRACSSIGQSWLGLHGVGVAAKT